MSEIKEVKSAVDVALNRIEELKEIRTLIENKKSELSVHESDLKAIKTINGVDSNEWKIKEAIINGCKEDVKKLEDKLSQLSYTKSELKPVLDELTKEFEDSLRVQQEREYHIEIGSINEETGKTNGKKVYKELLSYVQNDVEWTAKSAAGIMMLERNLLENKLWVNDKDFDGVITLRSANILVLWRSILEEMHGKGAFEAKKFLSCWANCGKGINEAVRDIQMNHESTRVLGTNLNDVESEYEISFNDIADSDAVLTTKEEIDPEI